MQEILFQSQQDKPLTIEGWMVSRSPVEWDFYMAELYTTKEAATEHGLDWLENVAESEGQPPIETYWVGRVSASKFHRGGVWLVDNVERCSKQKTAH